MKWENKNSRNFPVCRLQSMTEHPPVAGIGRYDIDKAWEKSMTSTSMKFCWSKVNVCSRHIPAVECGQLLWNVSYQHMLFYITGIITTLHLPECLSSSSSVVQNHLWRCSVNSEVPGFFSLNLFAIWSYEQHLIYSVLLWFSSAQCDSFVLLHKNEDFPCIPRWCNVSFFLC